MREIKFRAWDKSNKNFLYDLENDDGEGGGTLGVHCENLNEIVEQYTGLKDKNGVEIYGGDILKNKGILIGVVRFGEYRTRKQHKHDVQTNHLGWYVEQGIDKESLEGLFYNLQENCSIQKRDDQQWIEVVGNIHENPELLK